jgi:F-type H+-transporting ATPase subunit c
LPVAGRPLSAGCITRRKREGASTVSINHPLAANILTGAKESPMVRTLQFSKYFFMTMAAMFIATPAFAQGTSAAPDYRALAVGIGMGIAAGLCGLGQGRATASAAEALARNPGARAGIQLFLILGLAFIESLTLFTFVLLFLKTS